jgi:hypothetical protein
MLDLAGEAMRLALCESEQAVVEAVRSGRTDPRLQAHIAECPVCAEVSRVAHMLRREDELAEAGVQLPKAAQVWWRAQLRSRREAAERAVRPIAIVERFGCGAAVLAFAAAVAWQWRQFQLWLGWLGTRWANASPSDHRMGLWVLGLALSAAAFLLLVSVAGYVAHTLD